MRLLVPGCGKAEWFEDLLGGPEMVVLHVTAVPEALRLSMLALVRRGGGYAHPANWAPFVVVGEGAH
jgi:hypothetical protein